MSKVKKPAAQSRTNQTVVALLAVAVGERIARKTGLEPDAVTEALIATGEVVLGALAIYFRQRANAPVDLQDVETPTADALRKKPAKK